MQVIFNIDRQLAIYYVLFQIHAWQQLLLFSLINQN